MRTAFSLCALGALVLTGEAQAARPPQAPRPSSPVEFHYEPRGIYSLVAAPGQITDIVLEPGERLVTNNPIAAGDTARWIIGDTSSGEGSASRIHVLIKPKVGGLATNMVINTDRRTYLLVLRASQLGFLTQVSWRYPTSPTAPVLVAAPKVEVQEPKRPQNFGYRISGSKRFRPEHVYDDGIRTYLMFGPEIALSDLPPLFAVGADDKASELINYVVEGRTLIVDRLVDRLELRIGLGKTKARIRVSRASEHKS